MLFLLENNIDTHKRYICALAKVLIYTALRFSVKKMCKNIWQIRYFLCNFAVVKTKTVCALCRS